jgi:hypothetical protein
MNEQIKTPIRRKAKFLLVGIGGLIILALATFAVYIKLQWNLGIVEYIKMKCETRKYAKYAEEKFPLKEEKINQFVYNGWEFKIGETETEIRSNLGVPETEFHTYEFFYKDGPYLKLITGASEGVKDPKVLISELILDSNSISDSNKYKVKWGLNLGSSKKRVKEVLGEPYEIEAKKEIRPGTMMDEKVDYCKEEIWTYRDIEGPRNQVKFFFRDDILYRIEWQLYTG